MKHRFIPIALTAAVLGTLHAQVIQGPSSSETPYLTPTASSWSATSITTPFWSATSILTVGDAVSKIGGGTYRMAGIPDGLGAFDNDNGTFTLLANHEIGSTSGIVRAGTLGAFVSSWVISKADMKVQSGGDFLSSASNLYLWNKTSNTWTSGTPSAINRLCSADLPPLSAFYDLNSGLGYNGRIFMNGEEAGDEGRAFAWIVSGTEKGRVYEVPHLGKFSIENYVANPFTGLKTALVGTDDSTPGQVYVYIGDKTNTGNAVQKAGMTNGTLFGVKVTNGGSLYSSSAVIQESKGAINGSFTLTAPTYSTSLSGGTLQANSVSVGITEFARPEDAAWLGAGTLVFNTTGATVGGAVQSSRLYKLTFSDPSNLTVGGGISVIVDSAKLTGTDGQTARTFDNLTVGSDGLIYVQEDPGNNVYIAKHWVIDPNASNPASSALQIMESDQTRFKLNAKDFRTIDEEHSGIIDITEIMTGTMSSTTKYFLVATQNHAAAQGANAAELVEGGQFILLTKNASNSTYSAESITSSLTLSGDIISSGAGTTKVTQNVTLGSTGGLVQTAGSLTLSGKISGRGQLWKTGAGVLELSGSNDYTGNTNVSQGTLINNGSLTSDITVYLGGTLKGSGSSTGSLVNRGVFSPGNSPGITSYKNYTESGVLDVEIGGTVAGANPAGFDQVRVTNEFIADGGTLRLTKFNGFDPKQGQSFQVIQAGIYSGTGFAVLDRSTQTFQALYDHSTGTVYGTGLSESQTFAEYGGSVANRRNIGAALYADGLRTASVLVNGTSSSVSSAKAFISSGDLGTAAVSVLSASNPGLALDALSPESYIGLLEYSARTASAVSRSMRSTPLGPVGLGANIGYIYQRTGSSKSTTSLDTDMHSNASFLAVSYGLSDISAVSLIGSVDGGGVSSSNLSASPEGNTIGLGWAAKLWKTRFDLGLARGLHRGSASRAGQSASIDDLAGTVFASRVSLDPMAGFSPFAGISVTRARLDSINETGAGANLNVGRLNQSRTLGEIGMGYTRDLSKVLALDLSTSVEHDFRGSKTAISASFADAGATATPFSVEADAFGSTAVRAGAGLRYSLGKAGQIQAGYEFSGGNNMKASHEVRASYSIQF